MGGVTPFRISGKTYLFACLRQGQGTQTPLRSSSHSSMDVRYRTKLGCSRSKSAALWVPDARLGKLLRFECDRRIELAPAEHRRSTLDLVRHT
jgi:hypothetical protein